MMIKSYNIAHLFKHPDEHDNPVHADGDRHEILKLGGEDGERQTARGDREASP